MSKPPEFDSNIFRPLTFGNGASTQKNGRDLTDIDIFREIRFPDSEGVRRQSSPALKIEVPDHDVIHRDQLLIEKVDSVTKKERELKLRFADKLAVAQTVDEALAYTSLSQAVYPGFLRANGLESVPLARLETGIAPGISVRVESNLARRMRSMLNRFNDPDQIYLLIHSAEDCGLVGYRIMAYFPPGRPRLQNTSGISPGTIIYMVPNTACVWLGIRHSIEQESVRLDQPFAVQNVTREEMQKLTWRQSNFFSVTRDEHDLIAQRAAKGLTVEEYEVNPKRRVFYLAWIAMGAISNEQDRYFINQLP